MKLSISMTQFEMEDYMTTKDTMRLIQGIIGLGSFFLGLHLIHPGLAFIVIGLFFLFLFVARN
jgi:hypothetical protein